MSEKDEMRHNPEQDEEINGDDSPHIRERRLLAEFIGTFLLTMVAAGGEVVNTLSRGGVTLGPRMAAPGLLVAGLIYTVGNLSGAHFNPVVTLAFALRRNFPWRRVPGYWLVQIAGAIAAALLLRSLFGIVNNLGADKPHFGVTSSLVMEMVLTFILVTVILGTATNHQITGPNAALAVGGTIALDGFFGGPISGASMNPARSFGPAFVSGYLDNYWIYLVGPLIGALIAVGVAWLLRGGTTAEADKAAQGT